MKYILITALAVLSACAMSPEHIEPADITTTLVVGVPFSRIAGKDRSKEIAQLKGNCHEPL